MANDKVIAAFRRSAYAGAVKDLLSEELAAAREAHEGQTASSENTAWVNATKRVMGVLFGENQ